MLNYGFLECEHKQEKTKAECIIALKVYDNCRRQECLTHENLGPSRAVAHCSDDNLMKSSIIRPPQGTASVTIDELKIKKIYMQKKRPNPLKAGYWDLSIGFLFEYLLSFWDFSGCVISNVKASNAFTMKATLHGSIGNDMVVATDLCSKDKGFISDTAPYIWVDANAICLDAEIHRNSHRDCHDEVRVKIGLFSLIKLLRLEDINVESKGFFIPDECRDADDSCKYFVDFDFTKST